MAANDTVKVKVTADASQFKKEMKKVDGTLKKSQENASKMGGAVSGLGSALGGALPAQTGAAVSALGNLLDVVIAGGPIALGIAGLVAGIGLLVKEFNDLEAAAKKAEKAQLDAIAKAEADLNDLLRKRDVLRQGETKVAQRETRERLDEAKRAEVDLARLRASALARQEELLRLQKQGALQDVTSLARSKEELDDLDKKLERNRKLQELLKQQGNVRIEVAGLEAGRAKSSKSVAKSEKEALATYALQVQEGKKIVAEWKELERITRETTENMDAVTSALRADAAKERADAYAAAADTLLVELDLLGEIDEKNREIAESRASFAADQFAFAVDLALREKTSQDDILKAVLNRIRAEAFAHGTTMAIRGAGELALGNAGAAVTIGSGVALMAIGTGAAFAASNISGSAPSGGASAPVATSAPTGSVGPGQAAATQETTIINYVFNGPAFGMAEDDTARTITRLNARGSRLEGRG